MKSLIAQIRSSLGLQIALPASAVVIGLALVGIVAFYTQQRQSGIRLTLEKTAAIAQLAATSASPGVDFRNRESIQQALEGVTKLTGFRFVIVRGLEGDTLYTNGSALSRYPQYVTLPKPRATPDSTVNANVEQGIAVAIAPIWGTSGGIGDVILGISLEQTEQAVREGVQAFAFVGIIGGIVCAVVILFIVRRLTRPIVRLSDIAQRVSEGDLEQTMHTSSVNEVGRLSRAFNVMVGNIKQGVEELEKEKLSVERKVEEAVREADVQKRF